ncbi:ABC transporter ATP-binding protein [Brevibacillus agri]|uniref:ABC transporter ATP-binding protein n=1 Tax=Brevibacillus agri TaxID=51101 RepID=UPI002E20B108|nr:ABC transporter ATP-binding protein [Brevibacillus agri]MED3499637.1 ABC transporter ATP-binding protein [Brevibacillus agri]
MKDALLAVNDLRVKFRTENGVLPALQGISFQLKKGETVALVGESGCGKSVTSLAIMGLLSRSSTQMEGSIRFQGRELGKLGPKEMREIRGKEIAMIFQEPMTSLNPVHTIGKQLEEVYRLHTDLSKKERREQAIAMLKKVGVPRAEEIMREYPHQLSGGMKQRVMIAMAMACNPHLLIADEPTTALDVTIQAQILELMNDLKEKANTSLLLITHDLGVVAEMANRVLVMYYGEIVEEADVASLFTQPLHPYTAGLLRCIPDLDEEEKKRLHPIEGSVPLLGEVTEGCAFRFRCPLAMERCYLEKPPLSGQGTQAVRCWLYAKEEMAV